MSRVSLHDACMEASDIALLQPGHWLNDAVIHFAFEHMTHTILNNHSSLLLLSPAIVSVIQFLSDPIELHALLGGVDLASRQLVFLPINDADNAAVANAGSHWTLLVFARATMTFHHFDSLASVECIKVARKVAARLSSVLSSYGLFLLLLSLMVMIDNNH